ncbi:MAG: GNAT family N-acetyltransferase [Candidatus Sulfotelmatobacter sp.]
MDAATQIEIRRAGPEDAPAIATVLHESFVEFRALYTDGGFSATTPGTDQVLVRMQEGPGWVALREGTVLGTVAAVAKGDLIYIRGTAVLPDARGSGAGARLLQQLEVWAGSQGCTRLFLSTTPFLNSAIRLYKRFGFHRTDEGMHDEGMHDLFGTPLFTMEKILGIPPPRICLTR